MIILSFICLIIFFSLDQFDRTGIITILSNMKCCTQSFHENLLSNDYNFQFNDLYFPLLIEIANHFNSKVSQEHLLPTAQQVYYDSFVLQVYSEYLCYVETYDIK